MIGQLNDGEREQVQFLFIEPLTLRSYNSTGQPVDGALAGHGVLAPVSPHGSFPWRHVFILVQDAIALINSDTTRLADSPTKFLHTLELSFGRGGGCTSW